MDRAFAVKRQQANVSFGRKSEALRSSSSDLAPKNFLGIRLERRGDRPNHCRHTVLLCYTAKRVLLNTIPERLGLVQLEKSGCEFFWSFSRKEFRAGDPLELCGEKRCHY